MKKLLVAIVFLTIATGVFAQVTRNFTITVSVQYIDIQLRTADSTAAYANWNIGSVAAASTQTQTTTTAGTHVFVVNNSNAALNFSAYVANSTTDLGYGTVMNWAAGAAAAANVYKLDLGKGSVGSVPTAWQTITATAAPGNTYLTAEPAGTDHRLYARLGIPTSSSDGNQHNITVYVVAQ